MKLQHLVLAALAVSCVALLPVFASPQDAGATETTQEEAQPSLDESMQKLNRNLRQLRGVLKDDDAMLGKVDMLAEMQAVVVSSKAILPTKVAAMEDGEAKAAEVAAYRVDMNLFLRGLLDVEEAFLAGDGKAAKEHLQSLEKLKRTSHERFQDRAGGR